MQRNAQALLVASAAIVLAVTACITEPTSRPPSVAVAPASAAPTETAVPAATAEAQLRTITTSGTGSVSVAPDLLVARLGVEVRNENLSAALKEASDRIDAVTRTLTDAGISLEDVNTAFFNVRQEPADFREPDPENFVFVVSHILSVKIRAVEQAGEIVSAATDAGANRVDEISFTIEDDGPARSEARAKALEQARSHAQELAGKSGSTLGDFLAIVEGGATISPFPSGRDQGGGGGFQPGQLEVTVSVTVQYEVQ